MRQSRLFTKTHKEDPKGELSHNAQLLVRAGYIHKEMAGVYTYLPLGLRVIDKITTIIREEMNAIGGQEVLMTTLQDPASWKKSGRWDDNVVDIWFKTQLKNGSELGIANTHEEALTALLLDHVSSYKDLPVYIYQFQNKFRNELRAKSGIMRTREFIMKDLYSFSRNTEEFQEFYEVCAGAYHKIFQRAGIGHLTYRTYASGGSFSEFSDEFQTLSEAGEDTIYLDEQKQVAVNKEILNDDILKKLSIDKDKLVEKKAIEVGNIFPLGTKFSEAIGLRYTDNDGKEQTPIMGCYGIGLGRLMGTIVEVLSDGKGIVWPESVAPFQFHLIRLGEAAEVKEKCDRFYDTCQKSGFDILYDDREASAGDKLHDADLLGIPVRLVISAKTGEKIEYKKRTEESASLVDITSFIETATKSK
ncbi:MAG: aminoacyl--tRNA ligase-related protein [bacterium]|nr:aminoacyl--tRNA ligase-related protein [bacterium]